MCLENVARVVELPGGQDGIAVVETAGSLRQVSLALLMFDGVSVSPGDWLLCHTGLATRLLAADEARELVRLQEEVRMASKGADG